jgi:tetratricopeptide (TPR) repeat protein
MMKPLEPPDSIQLRVALGWCELHAFTEADAELDNINASLRAHPKVLEVRCQIYANLEKWAGALDIASAIVKLVPDWPNGWVYRASSLTELNRHQQAYETLAEGVARFPADKIILYDLACVCCALKRIDEARTWLGKAIDVGGKDVKLRALDDPDLEPLWKNTTGP